MTNLVINDTTVYAEIEQIESQADTPIEEIQQDSTIPRGNTTRFNTTRGNTTSLNNTRGNTTSLNTTRGNTTRLNNTRGNTTRLNNTRGNIDQNNCNKCK